MANEAKEQKKQTIEDLLADNWNEIIETLVRLKEKWAVHRLSVQSMNVDFVCSDLQKHINKGFNLGEFYIAVPDLIDYARSQGGIEYLKIEKERTR
jgi:hypothetical protein